MSANKSNKSDISHNSNTSNPQTPPPNNNTFVRPVGAGRIMMGMSSVDKSKHFKKTWGQLIRYIKPFLAPIVIALVLVTLAACMQVVGPSFMGRLTNIIKDGLGIGVDMSRVVVVGLTVIAIYAIFFVLRFSDNMIMAKYTQRISEKMRNDIAIKINKLPLAYFSNNSFGDILSRVTNDVDNIGQTLNQSIDTLLIATTMFVGSLVMMLVTNYIMAIAAIVSSLIGFVIMMLILRMSQRFFVAQQRELGAIGGYVEEMYAGHSVVKSYGASAKSKREFEAINVKIYSSAWKSQFFSGLMLPFMTLIGNLGYIAVCVSGTILALDGRVEIGTIVSFMLYIRIFTQPLAQFAQAANALQGTAASAERVFEFLNEPEQTDESDKMAIVANAEGNVEFVDVRFGYTQGREVIKGFSQRVAAGQKVAIVGPTGAGKTTIINLLMRFYDLWSGQILIDGVDIMTMKRESVHELFDMVLQDTWLFEGSIKQNIIYSMQNVSDDDVYRACQMVGLDHYIESLPDGYDTVLLDKASLSEGQKQLITIARAIIKNSPLLILDEATSSVDTRTEKMVQDAMDRLTSGRTSFVIAHRLSTIKNADIILVLREGDIIQKGSHDELLAQQGFYRELYNSQFDKI